jgi:transcriptional regulator NrdR family protein
MTTLNRQDSMRCPRDSCQSSNSSVRKTWAPNAERVKAAYKGLNLVRRQRICQDCNEYFYTIEIEETVYVNTCMISTRRR